MSGRAYVLPLAIATAFGVPYIASDSPQQPSQTAQPPAADAVAPYPNTNGAPFVTGQATGQIVSATPWVPVTPGAPPGTTIPQTPLGGALPGAGLFPGHPGHVYRSPGTPLGARAAPSFGTDFEAIVDPRQAVTSATGREAIMANLFDFGVTPQWVIQNWPSVSSEVSEPPLAGLRVAVVTGTGLHDLAGSMTYFFDEHQRLQRMIFDGSTGDPGALVHLLSTRYGLSVQPSLNATTYAARQKDQWLHLLRIRFAMLAKQSRPHQRYEVLVELNRPQGPLTLSAVNAATLNEPTDKPSPPHAPAQPSGAKVPRPVPPFSGR